MIDVHVRIDTDTGDKRGSRDRRDAATNPGTPRLRDVERVREESSSAASGEHDAAATVPLDSGLHCLREFLLFEATWSTLHCDSSHGKRIHPSRQQKGQLRVWNEHGPERKSNEDRCCPKAKGSMSH